MVKLNYIAIAKIIATSRDVCEIIDRLITYFRAHNPEFNGDKFREACYENNKSQ